MLDYQIAIPTYGRPDGVKKLTLNYLENTDVDLSRVTLFVANDAEKEKYQSSNPTYNIVVGEKGLTNQRHFISNHYDKGTAVFSFDDDVSAVEQLELLKELRCEGLVGREHQCWKPCAGDDIGDGEGLSRAGDAEQDLVFVVVLDAGDV